MLEKLPIDHPDFRYGSSRNPYWTKLREANLQVRCDSDTEAHRGQWRSQFPAGPGEELHLEIGCNAGHVSLEWAAQNPGKRYLGLDWKFKMIHKGAEKAAKRCIQNLIFLRANADRLKFMFAPGELDAVYLFFPDPWPKKAQTKNRFLTAERLKDIHSVLRPGGMFQIKTDHAGYFEAMEAAINETRGLWEIRERTTDLHGDNPRARELKITQVTLFERLFIQEGKPICGMKLFKPV